MSIFFKLEPKRVIVYPPPPSAAQIEDILQGLSDGQDVGVVSATVGVQPGLVEHLFRQCRVVEPGLVESLASDAITTASDALAYVHEHTVSPFPSAKFLAVMVDNAGGSFAKLVIACKAEVS